MPFPGEMSRPGSTLIQPEQEQLYVPLGPVGPPAPAPDVFHGPADKAISL